MNETLEKLRVLLEQATPEELEKIMAKLEEIMATVK